MKPLRLRMQAFGPYATVAEIDFRDLSLGGLFLIHGPTGAGKTSILDGLCFSLFGKSSGSERTAENLRCDLAASTLATEVTLEFSLGLNVYKVVRRPKQALKKVRGDGLTTSLPKGELYQMAAPSTGLTLESTSWTLLTSGDKKTDERVTELLGMSEEQFRQVVVLPQGQFRKFLSSSSDDREELLERLFRTEHFRQLTERIQAKASALASQITTLRQNFQAQLTSGGCESLEILKNNLGELEKRAHEIAGGEAGFQSRYLEAARRRDRAREVARLLSDLKVCNEKLAGLESRRGEISTLQDRLESEKRGRPVLSLDGQVVTLETEVANLQKQKTTEETKLAEFTGELQTCLKRKQTLETYKPQIEEKRARYLSLQKVFVNAKQLKDEVTKLAQAESEWTRAKTQAQLEGEKYTAARLQKDKLSSELNSLRAVLEEIGPLRLVAEKTQSEVGLLKTRLTTIEAITARQKTADENRHATLAAYTSEKLALDRLKLRFHLSQASLLARELKEGDPCPVCGSESHPKPAHLTSVSDSTPDAIPEAIEREEEKLRRSADAAASAKARSESLVEEIQRALHELPGSSREVAASQLSELISKSTIALEKLNDLETKEKLATQIRRQLESLEADLLRLELAAKSLESQRENARILLETGKAKVAQLEEQVPADLRDLETITGEGKSLRAELDQFEKDVSAVSAHLQATSEKLAAARANVEMLSGQIAAKSSQRLLAHDNLRSALKASGFATLDEARATALSTEECRALELAKKSFDDEWAAASARAEDLRGLEKNLEPWSRDLDICEAEYVQLRDQRDQRANESGALGERIQSLRALEKKATSIEAEMAQLSERYSTLGKLSAVANGQPPHNVSRVNFSRFVLAARLDEVLDQASRRLFLMSRGQFILRRSRSADDKRKNAGLDLEVEDSFTGTSRPTSSLSGGEGFLASLSLALGLADVVQSRLGGIRLDAVFVDEGFGTLDGEALELAIKTLSELQAGGRLVGIISHVPELKDQIARRLHVKKSAVGSQVVWENSVF
jgi:exonuclease SbcC